MATFTEARVRERAARSTIFESASAKLERSVRVAKASSTMFDVFLSHSIKDSELVLGVKLLLEDAGRSVYVDWIEDPNLDRTKVDPATAEKLRERMRSCRSLIYIHSGNSGGSKWMPWELGFFDGYSGAVAVLPVTVTAQQDFVGQEYLGLYPWVDDADRLFAHGRQLKIHKSASGTSLWEDWTKTPRSFYPTS